MWWLTERISPDYVVSEVETVTVEALKHIEEDTGATAVPARRACELMRCRESVREVAERIGLPVTAYRFAESAEELGELGLTCLVKLEIMTSDKGYVLLKQEEDVEKGRVMVCHVSSDKISAWWWSASLTLTMRPRLLPCVLPIRLRAGWPHGSLNPLVTVTSTATWWSSGSQCP
mgnify:CR=1 FL=1